MTQSENIMPAYNIIATHNKRQVGTTIIAAGQFEAIQAATDQLKFDVNAPGSAINFFKRYRIVRLSLIGL